MTQLVRIVVALCLFVTSSAWSQESDSWDWRVVPYLWGLNIDGTMAVGPIEEDLDVSFSDIVSDMDFGASLFAQFSKGKHGFHLDYTYLRLKPDVIDLSTPPFPPGSTVTPKMTINVLEGGYNWHFNTNRTLVIGARYLDLDMRMAPDLTGPGPIDPDPLQEGPSWVDYFVGLNTEHQISQKWGFNFYGTVGFGGSDFPWTLQGAFARKFSNDNRLSIGVRVWGIDYSDNKNSFSTRAVLDSTLYGLLIGYEFN